MIHISEVIGSELPILLEKETGMLSFDEIIYINENIVDYKLVGFIQIDEDKELYEKIYIRK